MTREFSTSPLLLVYFSSSCVVGLWPQTSVVAIMNCFGSSVLVCLGLSCACLPWDLCSALFGLVHHIGSSGSFRPTISDWGLGKRRCGSSGSGASVALAQRRLCYSSARGIARGVLCCSRCWRSQSRCFLSSWSIGGGACPRFLFVLAGDAGVDTVVCKGVVPTLVGRTSQKLPH